ncbi:MAG TPA: AraC family transcriptional regulator [Gemmatimonadales bacterium]
MAKIAVALEHALARRRALGDAGRTAPRTIATGDGWAVADVLCTSGPRDRTFEERHALYAIAMVLAGSFQYRSPLGAGLMAPGSLMLGNPGLTYECGHEHAEGDRCVVFWYDPDYFEQLAGAGFRVPRLPPVRPLAPLLASACTGVLGASDIAWEELAVRLAVETAGLAAKQSAAQDTLPRNAEARVTRAVREIDRHPDAKLALGNLARESGLSPYHFLRTFERLTGVTPHQYVLRARLRDAATRLITEPRKIIDVALDSGFGDVSNFNRAFRAEFGVSPRTYRAARGSVTGLAHRSPVPSASRWTAANNHRMVIPRSGS